MATSRRLNERQKALLERIASGDTLSAPDDVRLRLTAYALSSRGLVSTSKHGGVFSARLTGRGRLYLERDARPSSADTPETAVVAEDAAGSSHTRPRREAPAATARLTQQQRAEAVALVQRLGAEHTIVIDRPDEQESAHWRKVVDFAKRHALVPDEFRIEKRTTPARDLEIRLIAGAHFNNAEPSTPGLPEVPVRDTIDDLHPVVAALGDSPGALAVCAQCVPRALRILDALARGAEKLGHGALPAADPDALLAIQVPHERYELTLEEEYEQALAAEQPKYDWQRITEYEPVPTGRLELILLPRTGDRLGQHRWADRKRWSLEDKLPQALEEILQRGQAAERDRLDRQRAKIERRRRWGAAMRQARADYIEHRCAAHLHRQLEHWREAQEINAFCDAVQHQAEREPDPQQAASMRAWIAWARAHARHIDPLHADLGVPDVPEPTAEDLRPFLHGWSPYGPGR